MTTKDKELLKEAQAYYSYSADRTQNFLFYCNPKAGSSSLKHMLDISNENKWKPCHDVSALKSYNVNFFDKRQFFSFGFVRNPYDRAYSTYKMLMLFARELVANNLVPGSASLLHWHKINSYKTFDEFVKKEIIEAAPTDNHLRKQADFLLFGRDPVIDFIGKFENFENDFASLQKEVETLPLLRENCKTVNLQSREYARLIEKYDAPRFVKEMTGETRESLEEFYKEDFENFNYSKKDLGDFKII